MSLKKNIIYLHFKGKHLITSKSQYQYNYGQYLYFADLNLPQAFEVHFSNKERGESETQIGSNKLVEIPDKYFWNSALEIYAWVYLHDETNDGKTIYEVRIPLIKRARPTDKEPLPDQQSAIDKAIAELNNALNITNENADKTNADKTQVATIKEEVVTLKEEIDSTANAVSQDAQSANTAAERSEQSAQNSAESERKALDYSDEAKGYAQSAFESKNTASQKAQVATDAAAEAKGFRDEAETFKNEAEQIKQNVVDYRNETKGYRDEALTAKNDAQDSANAAQETLEQVTQAGEEIIESVRDLGSRYATQAETAANNAQTSASQASASASASANSASQAEQTKTAVEDMVEDAQGYSNSASQSASASAQSASDAHGYAQSASASAQSASGYASNAQTSANTASNKASEASTSAQTASQKATEAAQSASQALGYKTDAESAKTASQTAQGLAESARDSAISAKNDAESARDEAQQAVASISGALTEKAPIITDTASGSIASFTDGADDLPLKSLIVDINPIQDLSNGDPSPTNICPISGWTEVDVEQSGKNLFDNGMTLEDGYIDPGTGQVTASQNAYNKHTPLIPIAPSISLVANKVQALAANNSLKTFFAGWAYYDINKNFISGKWNPSATDTPPTNARFLVLSITGSATNNAYFTPEAIADFVKDYSLAYGSTATPYEPYTGRSITIDLGQTVYGGRLDVLSGELVIDRAMVDLGTLNWGLASNQFYANLVGAKLGEYSIKSKALCSVYPTLSWAAFLTSGTDKAFAINSGQPRVNVKDSTYTDATAFKTAMNGVQLCYELAEPIEIQLTPHEVNSLLGVNNIWADSGDTTAEYRADTKLYIERLTAPDSADMIADANITSGQYFMVGNSLYKATANIANGSAIIVGTNCIRKSLSEALNEINA